MVPPDHTLYGLTAEQIEGLKSASDHELAFIKAETDWIAQARQTQILPIDFGPGISKALFLTGRGWGKTQSAAGWARRKAGTMPGSIGHVVAPTHADLIGTVFKGISGLLSVIPDAMIADYKESPYVELLLKNGTVIRGFSAEKPDRLRGPQCHWLWGDEVAAWLRLDETMANIDFSTRLVYLRKRSDNIIERIQPQRIFTTTPRPLEQIRDMAEDPKVFQVRGSLYENKDNLAETFIADVAKHEGTKLGDQEIYGKILNFDESAIIKKRWLRMWPKDRPLPPFEFIFSSFDTAFTEETYDDKTGTPDYSACTTWGVFLFEKKMQIMLLNAWRDRLGMPDLIERVREEVKLEYGLIEPVNFKTYVGQAPTLVSTPRKPALIIIEDKGSGISLRQMLVREDFKVPLHPYNPGKADKTARLHSVAHVAKGGAKEGDGRVWLIESGESTETKPRFVTWADDWLSEVCIYTGPKSTKYDDYIDTTSQGWRYFADRFISGPVSDKVQKRAPRPPAAPNPYG